MSIKEIKIADKETLDEVKTLLESMRSTQVVSLDAIGDFVKNVYEEVLTINPYTMINDMIVFKGEIHILGGYKSEYKHYKFDGTEWSSVSTLPIKLYGGIAFVYNDEIHILDTTSHYKFDGAEWSSVSTLPYDIDGCAVVIYNDEIHVLGGSSNNKKHYKFNGTEWTEVSTLPYYFYKGSAVVYNDEIHILGTYGYSDEDTQKLHYKFNGTEWTEVSTLPISLIGRNCAVLCGDAIHIAYSSNGIYKHYKFDGTTWTELPDLPEEYGYNSTQLLVLNNEVHFLAESKDLHHIYKTLNYKQLPTIYLPKDTNIYSSDELLEISNCTLVTDHLVVTEDGNVSFATFTEDTKSIITLC